MNKSERTKYAKWLGEQSQKVQREKHGKNYGKELAKRFKKPVDKSKKARIQAS